MIATTGPVLATTASDLMSRDVVTIAQDTPLVAAAELFCRKQIGEAAVVDRDGRCVGVLCATDLIRWTVQVSGAADGVSPPACPYQVQGWLLTGEEAVICTRAAGTCPLQELRAMTGGRHTAVCLLRGGLGNECQQGSRRVPLCTVQRSLSADAATVGTKAPLSVLARAVIDAHVHSLIVVDEQHRPIGTVSCLDVLTALARVPSARG
jgi:CBS-domain-containing membrane protein